MKHIKGTWIFELLLSASLFGCGSEAQDERSQHEPSKNYGVSVFAITHETFPCSQFIEAMEQLPEWRVATLWNTFGDWKECLELTLRHKKTKAIQVHLVNEVCQRNDRCEEREFLFGTTPERYQEILKRELYPQIMAIHDYQTSVKNWLLPRLQPQTECYISPGLESNLHDAEAIASLLSLTKSIWGERCVVVWNPINSTYKNLAADYFETHGAQATSEAPCIRNLDGVDIDYPSGSSDTIHPDAVPGWLARGSACALNLIWSRESNCLNKDTWEPPTKRTCSASRWPELVSLLLNKPDTLNQ